MKSRKVREEAFRNNRTTNAKYHGCYASMWKNNTMLRLIQETLRMTDAKEAEKHCGQKKLEHKHEFVDLKARNAFILNDATPLIIKCAHGFNHFGLRDFINVNMVEACCLICDSAEMWDHTIKCNETIELRKEFIEQLLIKILKQKGDADANLIMSFCEDILRYLENEEEEEYETNQHFAGMKELFCGYAVIDWEGANLKCTK